VTNSAFLILTAAAAGGVFQVAPRSGADYCFRLQKCFGVHSLSCLDAETLAAHAQRHQREMKCHFVAVNDLDAVPMWMLRKFAKRMVTFRAYWKSFPFLVDAIQ